MMIVLFIVLFQKQTELALNTVCYGPCSAAAASGGSVVGWDRTPSGTGLPCQGAYHDEPLLDWLLLLFFANGSPPPWL